MFEILKEIFIEIRDALKPWIVVDHFNAGVRLRFGKPTGALYAGFHWKIPFVDEIFQHMIKAKTMNLSPQTITTKDDQTITVVSVIKYDISDIEQLLLEVNSAEDAIGDMTQGIIRQVLMGLNWDECNDSEVEKRITTRAKTEGSKWGINVTKVTLTQMAKGRMLRIFGDNPLGM